MTPGARVAAQIEVLERYSVWGAGRKSYDQLGHGAIVLQDPRIGLLLRDLVFQAHAVPPVSWGLGQCRSPRGPGLLGPCEPMERIQMSFLPEQRMRLRH